MEAEEIVNILTTTCTTQPAELSRYSWSVSGIRTTAFEEQWRSTVSGPTQVAGIN